MVPGVTPYQLAYRKRVSRRHGGIDEMKSGISKETFETINIQTRWNFVAVFRGRFIRIRATTT